ncbi:BZ3500_MvSof-1268-A1-R1_Chr2-1g04612 [Microbotryum saponariae]|uniref:BZ3500_MvSof-1268-A1-R1_Chr2-1g04612 protein n=1 Tax=Microbotryum saponariae TaxID=289078 RepID=A0A2X0M3J3_9BASI|nr:BZ3500_MvSof-1268-A1-R1_Chr2-1g04612 [Microbotryum saponariae]SCZ92132.1 BZ3501_MvSof-1269-A2-R1_Chr2-1g04268 [Microbotryum saponariae]
MQTGAARAPHALTLLGVLGMRVRNRAFIGNLFRSARLFSEAWRCAPTVVFSPRLDYTLVSL